MDFNNITVNYPNPATDQLNITSTVKWTNYEIYSLGGHLIKSSRIPTYANTFAINLNDIANGSYSISLRNNKELKTLKFIVAK